MPCWRARSRIWNQGAPIGTPRAFTSFDLATAQPSLFDRTTTGRSRKRGLKARSQLTYILFTSTSAKICLVESLISHPQLSHDARHHTPNLQFATLGQADRLVRRVVRAQLYPTPLAIKALEGIFGIDDGNDNVTMQRRDGAVDHNLVAIQYAGIAHRIALDREKERGGLVLNQQRVQVQAILCVVGGRRRKPSGYAMGNFRPRAGKRELSKRQRHLRYTRLAWLRKY